MAYATRYARRYDRRYDRPARSTEGPIVIKDPTAPATDAQVGFVRALLADPAAASLGQDALSPEVFATLAAVVGGHPVSKGAVSDAIGALKAAVNGAQAAQRVSSLPAGLAELSPTKVIGNRFEKKCWWCRSWVGVGTGHAALIQGEWRTYCAGCAASTAADRKVAEAAAAQAAEEARKKAEAVAIERQARQDRIVALTIDLARRIGAEDTVHLGVALPCETGANDLTFLLVSRAAERVGGAVKVTHVVGGNREYGMSGTTWGLRQLERIACLSDVELFEAAATFGRELGKCARCGRSLTDEESRARGLGPDCAAKLSF